MQLSIEATKAYEFKDWWWNLQLGKCYYLLNMLRESEQNFRLALRQHASIEVFLRLIQIYKKLDQPLTALEVCKRASVVFPSEISFMVESARLDNPHTLRAEDQLPKIYFLIADCTRLYPT